MGRKRHRLMRKPVSKKRTWINIFLQLFPFSEMHRRLSFPKVKSLQRFESKAEPLFDKKVRKATPLQLTPFALPLFVVVIL